MKPEPIILYPKWIESAEKFGEPVISIESIVNALDVVGFQDQGKDKVAEIIQDKFQELIQGNIDVLPNELLEYADIIMSAVEYLSKIST